MVPSSFKPCNLPDVGEPLEVCSCPPCKVGVAVAYLEGKQADGAGGNEPRTWSRFSGVCISSMRASHLSSL